MKSMSNKKYFDDLTLEEMFKNHDFTYQMSDDNRYYEQGRRQSELINAKLEEHRRRMADSIGREAYNGVNVFEGVEPMHHSEPQAGAPDLGNPSDAGVDISSLMGDASKIWQAMK